MKGQEKYNSPFAANLRSLIAQNGTTITALAKVLGISRQAVSQYADGTGQPNVDKLAMIADYFGVSADYLLGLSDIPTRNETIQGVHKLTGISQKAVSSLTVEKALGSKDIADLISYLIESEQFDSLVSEIKKLSVLPTTTEATLGVDSDLYEIDFQAAFKLIVTDMFWEIIRGYNKPLEVDNG